MNELACGEGGRTLECTELSASPSSLESLRRLPWCTCVSASARQSRAQCCAREFCCKILSVLVFKTPLLLLNNKAVNCPMSSISLF